MAALRPRDIRLLTVADLTQRVRAGDARAPGVLRRMRRDARAGVRALAAQVLRRDARDAREAARLSELCSIEEEQRALGFPAIAGVDEVGVAPLAGPVVAAAVILPPGLTFPHLNDSKRLSAEQRDALYPLVLERAEAWALGMASVEEIDRLNILQAMRLAHRRAILALTRRPSLVLIDGRYAADVPLPQLVVVDGDAICASIAAASVVAKVTRDRMMVELAARYPAYGFDRHKGYSTPSHREAIDRYGPTPYHRRSFLPVRFRQQALGLG
jgi:ribonuclease HII